MVMGARNRRVDPLHAVLSHAAFVERGQQHIPNFCKRPAPELLIDETPPTKVVVQVTPQRSHSSNPEYLVQDQTMVFRPAASSWSRLDHERREKAHFSSEIKPRTKTVLPKENPRISNHVI
jgi:hypothetical protein